jgi:hypothetical protein
MSNLRSINLFEMRIALSQNTIDSLSLHQSFVAAGQDWLIGNDPDGALEMEYLQRVADAVRIDVEEAIKDLSIDQQEVVLEKLCEMSTGELFDSCIASL